MTIGIYVMSSVSALISNGQFIKKYCRYFFNRTYFCENVVLIGNQFIFLCYCILSITFHRVISVIFL